MSTVQTAFISALLLGLMGCATVPATESTAFDCAPLGYERLDGWQVRERQEGLATATETGQPVQITQVALSRGDQALLLVFMGEALILVDPNPLDKSVPLLVNTSYFTADDKLRADPRGDCGWRELLSGETT